MIMEKRKLKQDDKNIFKFARIARGLSVNDVAEKIACSPTYIRAIEKGKRIPSDAIYKDYLKVLDIDEEVVSTFTRRSKKFDTYETVLFTLLQIICKIS